MSERERFTWQSVHRHELVGYRYGDGASRVIVAHGIMAHQSIPELRALAAALAQRYAVTTLDFRGHGESGGFFSLGRFEHRDLSRLIEIERQQHKRVGLVGFSFGGFHSVLAANNTEVDALCLVSTPAHLRVLDHFPLGGAWIRTVPHIVGRRRGLVRVNPFGWPRVRPIDVIDQIEVPIRIIHGDDDWLVSLRHAEMLYRKVKNIKDLAVVTRGLHAEYLLKQDPLGMAERIQSWMDDHLVP